MKTFSDHVLALVRSHPGIKFYEMPCHLPPHKFRELDRTLQKLRRSGEIEFRKGKRAGWHIKQDKSDDRP